MQYNSGVAHKPTIFVSSTCYDLKQIRQNLKDFIENELGYEAILSEYDSFPINPDINTVNNCIRVVEERADIFVLIIGGRYGYVSPNNNKSITNMEYLRARSKGIPIFAFVDQSIINILPVWEKNIDGDFSGVVDSTKIFEFVDNVRNKDSIWVYEFNSGNNITSCLKKQLAYLVNDSLMLRKHFYKEGVSSKILQYSGRVFELAIEKPDFWEYLLLAAVLKDKLSQLDDLRYDLKYGLFMEKTSVLEEPQEIISYVQAKSSELTNRTGMIDTLFNKALQEALGAPGTPGNAEHIIYVAEKLIDVYVNVHKWTLQFKSVVVPEEFENLISAVSHLSDTVIEDIENFISDFEEGINRLIMEHTGEPQKVIFTLTLRSPDVESVNKEVERLLEILL